MPKILSFNEFLTMPKKIRVEVPASYASNRSSQLDEATRTTVGRYTARRDQPHFQGDEYHGHADVPGGYEVSWNISGSRRHPGKFPANVPSDAKAAVAKVLGVSADLLECYRVQDEVINEEILLFELRQPSDTP